MPSLPTIYRSLGQLRTQLKKLEPRKILRRIGPGETVAFAVDYLEFDPSIPILKERHLKDRPSDERSQDEGKATEKRQEQKSSEKRCSKEKRSKEKHLDDRHVGGEPSGDSHENGMRKEESSLDDLSGLVGESNLSNIILGESQFGCDGHVEEQPPSERRVVEEDTSVNSGHLSEPDESTHDSNFVDRLILTGPEEDEFRQYDDDDEEETVISRNRKKISTEAIVKEVKTSNPLARPYPPVQPPRPAAQPVPSTPRESPRNSLSGQLVPQQNGTPQQQVPEPKEVTIADITKFLDQKNLLVVHKELEQHMSKLPQADVRLLIRKAVFTCLERDETFMLLKFIKLVFETNFNEDPKFWDELIGKLKRKNNPHAKCLTFRSEVDPRLVLQNYQSIIKQIGEYFDRTNPTVTLPWLTFIYLRDACKPPPSLPPPIQLPLPLSLPSSSLPAIGSAQSTSSATTPTQASPMAQENLDPEKLRHVLEISAGINKKEFKISIPRRQATFSPKLLIRKPKPTT